MGACSSRILRAARMATYMTCMACKNSRLVLRSCLLTGSGMSGASPHVSKQGGQWAVCSSPGNCWARCSILGVCESLMVYPASQDQKICCSVSAALPQKGQLEEGRRPL